LIAISICVSVSYGLPNIIYAGKEFYHQGVMDKMDGVDALVKIENAKALLNFSKLSINVPIAYIVYRGGTFATLGAFGAIIVLGNQ
jgi:hypothetical protein